MYHAHKLRGSLCVSAAVILLTASLCACNSSTNTGGDDSKGNLPITTESSAIGTEDSSSSTGEADPSTGTTEAGTTTTNSHGTDPITTTSRREEPVTTTSAPKSHQLTLSLEQWHPGVAGYDAEYTIVPVMDDQLVGAKQMKYTSSASEVRISGNTVTIPYSVRSKGQPVTITGTESATGAKAAVSIACKSWTSTFADEFNGTSVDSSKWGTHEEGGGGTISATYRNNATVADGKLSLWVKKETVTINGKTFDYTQGGISTLGRFTQKYGLFTCSMKIPKQSSLNSAFWMIPGGAYGSSYMLYEKTKNSKGCGELDIVEASGYWGKKYCITEHFFDTKMNKEHTSKHLYPELSVNPAETFVEYSCAWLENGLYYYADGKLVWLDTDIGDIGGSNGQKTGRPGYLILTLGLYAPDHTWCGPWEFKDSDFPIALEVDFARAYK